MTLWNEYMAAKAASDAAYNVRLAAIAAYAELSLSLPASVIPEEGMTPAIDAALSALRDAESASADAERAVVAIHDRLYASPGATTTRHTPDKECRFRPVPFSGLTRAERNWEAQRRASHIASCRSARCIYEK